MPSWKVKRILEINISEFITNAKWNDPFILDKCAVLANESAWIEDKWILEVSWVIHDMAQVSHHINSLLHKFSQTSDNHSGIILMPCFETDLYKIKNY